MDASFAAKTTANQRCHEIRFRELFTAIRRARRTGKCSRRQGINRDPRGFERGRDFRDMGPRMNERIRVREILVIDDNGEKLGVMTPREALDIARSKGLDLIEVAPQAQPPVCRILDYGKFKYEQGKREREAAKKARQSELKGMTLTPRIDDHDLEIKIANVVKFLTDGDKVKVAVRFRSREMSHPEFAQAALNKMVQAMTEAGVGVVERPPLMEGKQMIMILAPQRDNAQKKPAAPGPARPPGDRPERPAGDRPTGERAAAAGRPVSERPAADGTAPEKADPAPVAPVPVASAPVETENNKESNQVSDANG